MALLPVTRQRERGGVRTGEWRRVERNTAVSRGAGELAGGGKAATEVL